uniref:Uncharacterized protein n=1 Tax=Arundo donax TaxID=35708 RepID=A0A0A9CAJ7_ARUDO
MSANHRTGRSGRCPRRPQGAAASTPPRSEHLVVASETTRSPSTPMAMAPLCPAGRTKPAA